MNILDIEAFGSIVFLQLCRHRRNNLLTIFSTLITKHVTIYSLTYMPIHHRHFRIGSDCYLPTSTVDNTSQIINQNL